MAENTQICSICDQNHVSRSSAFWCSECEQAFCSDCKLYHGSLKLFKSHVPIPISDYQALASSVASINSYCIEHEEKYQMFCQSHDSLLCPECIEKHSECKDIMPLSKMTVNIKASQKFIEIEQSLTDIDTNIQRIKESLTQNQGGLKGQADAILCTISQVRKSINEHLDKIEKEVKKDISEFQSKNRIDTEFVLKSLDDKKIEIAACKLQLENIKNHASELQTFFGLRQISAEVSTAEAFIQSIVENGSLDKITLNFSIDKNIKSIRNNIHTFGVVRVEKSSYDLNLVKQKEKQAQLVGMRSKSINDIKVKLKQTFDTEGKGILGCDILSDGTMVFSGCDRSEDSLIVIDSEGKYLFEVSLEPCGAFDVTKIDVKTVAVTSPKDEHSGVNIIDIRNRKILKFFAKKYPCYGITTCKGSLVYCVKGKGIEMMDFNGKNTTTIVRCNLPAWTYIAEYNDKLYYTNPSTKTVTCCDAIGKKIWTFKVETVLDTLYGISVDNDGHVYVVTGRFTSVVVLSADGQQSKQVFLKDEGLGISYMLYFNRDRKQLLISNSDENVMVYEVLQS